MGIGEVCFYSFILVANNGNGFGGDGVVILDVLVVIIEDVISNIVDCLMFEVVVEVFFNFVGEIVNLCISEVDVGDY